MDLSWVCSASRCCYWRRGFLCENLSSAILISWQILVTLTYMAYCYIETIWEGVGGKRPTPRMGGSKTVTPLIFCTNNKKNILEIWKKKLDPKPQKPRNCGHFKKISAGRQYIHDFFKKSYFIFYIYHQGLVFCKIFNFFRTNFSISLKTNI